MEVLSEATPAIPSRVSDLTETLPPSKKSDLDCITEIVNFSKTLYIISADWEVRRDATGRDVYYDHDNKVVRLDRPDQGTGQSGFCLVCHGTCTMHKFI